MRPVGLVYKERFFWVLRKGSFSEKERFLLSKRKGSFCQQGTFPLAKKKGFPGNKERFFLHFFTQERFLCSSHTFVKNLSFFQKEPFLILGLMKRKSKK